VSVPCSNSRPRAVSGRVQSHPPKTPLTLTHQPPVLFGRSYPPNSFHLCTSASPQHLSHTCSCGCGVADRMFLSYNSNNQLRGCAELIADLPGAPFRDDFYLGFPGLSESHSCGAIYISRLFLNTLFHLSSNCRCFFSLSSAAAKPDWARRIQRERLGRARGASALDTVLHATLSPRVAELPLISMSGSRHPDL